MSKKFFAALCCVALTSCSSSSSTSDSGDGTANTALTGILVDSAVEGVAFTTETQSGVTDIDGSFTYQSGETVMFSIGDMFFPEVESQDQITPVTMSPTKTIEDNTTVNIARLLQSLDEDNNPNNGIRILEVAAQSATAVDFSVSPDEFSENVDVINLVANSGSVSTVLISAEPAVSHLSNTLGIPDFVRIFTEQEYRDQVVDVRQGRADSENWSISNSDGTLGGNFDGVDVTGTWTWENSFFCREGLLGDFVIEPDCQIIEVNGNIMRATRSQGSGDVVEVILER